MDRAEARDATRDVFAAITRVRSGESPAGVALDLIRPHELSFDEWAAQSILKVGTLLVMLDGMFDLADEVGRSIGRDDTGFLQWLALMAEQRWMHGGRND